MKLLRGPKKKPKKFPVQKFLCRKNWSKNFFFGNARIIAFQDFWRCQKKKILCVGGGPPKIVLLKKTFLSLRSINSRYVFLTQLDKANLLASKDVGFEPKNFPM